MVLVMMELKLGISCELLVGLLKGCRLGQPKSRKLPRISPSLAFFNALRLAELFVDDPKSKRSSTAPACRSDGALLVQLEDVRTGSTPARLSKFDSLSLLLRQVSFAVVSFSRTGGLLVVVKFAETGNIQPYSHSSFGIYFDAA